MVKTSRKKKIPDPNYISNEYHTEFDRSIWRYWLAESKDFYSPEDLEENTYYEKGKWFTIEKIQNEI